jgi:hypothetical protein
VIDYKTGDSLPAIHSTTYEYSHFPRLIMHYLGFFIDNSNTSHYYLHTEHWTESVNTIITTLNKLLTKLSTLQPDLVLTTDGHLTNRNNSFMWYLYFLIYIVQINPSKYVSQRDTMVKTDWINPILAFM